MTTKTSMSIILTKILHITLKNVVNKKMTRCNKRLHILIYVLNVFKIDFHDIFIDILNTFAY